MLHQQLITDTDILCDYQRPTTGISRKRYAYDTDRFRSPTVSRRLKG